MDKGVVYEMNVKYYSIHDLITVKTNMNNVKIPDCFLEEEVKGEPDIEIVQERLEFSKPERAARSRNYFYWTDGATLFMDYAVPLMNAKLVVDGLEGKTKIKVTESLNKFGRVELPSFNSILDLKLIQKDFALLHSGCLNYKGQCFLITASRDTGKTSTVLSLFDGKDFKFMSDDLTIVSRNGEAHSYPEKVGISPHTLTGTVIPPHSGKNVIKGRLAKYHFLTLLFGRFLNLELVERKEVPHDLIEDKGTIKKIFILKGGNEKEEIEQIGTAEAVEKILSATLGLINPSKVFLLNFYSYVLDFDLYGLLFEKKKIVEEAIKDAECFEVRSNNVRKYSEMIKETIGG